MLAVHQSTYDPVLQGGIPLHQSDRLTLPPRPGPFILSPRFLTTQTSPVSSPTSFRLTHLAALRSSEPGDSLLFSDGSIRVVVSWTPSHEVSIFLVNFDTLLYSSPCSGPGGVWRLPWSSFPLTARGCFLPRLCQPVPWMEIYKVPFV